MDSDRCPVDKARKVKVSIGWWGWNRQSKAKGQNRQKVQKDGEFSRVVRRRKTTGLDCSRSSETRFHSLLTCEKIVTRVIHFQFQIATETVNFNLKTLISSQFEREWVGTDL